MEWENGDITEEPLAIIAADYPITCAIYVKEKGLLDKEGWKCFKKIAPQEKHFLWLVWQAKIKSFQHAPKYKFGYQIPHNYEEALRFDKINHSTKWADATKIEMLQLNDSWMTMSALLMQASTTVILSLRVIRRYKSTLCTMSSLMDITRHALLVMDTSPMSQLVAWEHILAQELFHFMAYEWSPSLQSLMGWTCGPQI